MQVTAHELKLHFGHYLEAVRHGQTLCITWRGQAIADMERGNARGSPPMAPPLQRGDDVYPPLSQRGRVRVGATD